VSALKHAQAFISALMNEDGGIERDLQIIFPLLLGALWETQDEIRREAAMSVRLISGAKSSVKAPEVYGLKNLPGSVTSECVDTRPNAHDLTTQQQRSNFWTGMISRVMQRQWKQKWMHSSWTLVL